MAPSAATLEAISMTGTVLAVILFASQIPTYYVVIKNRTVGSLSILPTIGVWANTSAWVVYALIITDRAVLLVNVIGAAFAVAYLVVFFAFSVSKIHTGAAIAGVLALCAAVYGGISLPASLPHDQKASIMGSVAVACNVFLFASPLAQMRIALVTFDPGAIPMLLVAVGTATSVLWGFYGILISNWFVAGPNLAGIVLGLMQLGIAAYIVSAVRRNPSLQQRGGGMQLQHGGGSSADDDDAADSPAALLLAESKAHALEGGGSGAESGRAGAMLLSGFGGGGESGSGVIGRVGRTRIVPSAGGAP